MVFEKRDFIIETIGGSRPRTRDITRQFVQKAENRYSSPDRYYHTTRHIDELFGLLETHQAEVENPRLVASAILYHDLLYDPIAKHGNNEEISARLAEHDLPKIMWYGHVATVAHYIRATAGHEPGDNADLNFFLDADVSILGATPERYDEYAQSIRLEYAHVPEDAYRAGRTQVLGHLATRAGDNGLFVTDLFNGLYAASAQANIARELESLR